MRPRLLAALVLVPVVSLRAQSERVVRSETNAWLDANADVWLTPRWGAQGQFLYERSDYGAEPMVVEARLGVQRRLSTFRLAVGGTYIHTSPYGPFRGRGPTNESRAWEQLSLDGRLGHVALAHRVRLEERWLGRPQAAGVAPDILFSLRARYQFRGTVPLTPSAKRPLYAAGGDEIFVSFGAHGPAHPLDQNRAYLGAGVRWSPSLRTELGYLNQRIMRANGQQVENNHTAQLTLGYTRAARKR